MLHDDESHATGEVAPANPRLASGLAARWVGLLSLLLVEYIAISLRFDAQPLIARAGLSGAFGYFGIAAPLLVVTAAAAYLVAGERFRAEAVALLGRFRERTPLAPCVAVNLAAYGGVFAVTQAIVELPPAQGDVPGSWFAGWLALVVVAIAALLKAALPWRAMLPLLRRSLGIVVVGGLAGALAWMAGIASGGLYHWLRGMTLSSVYWLIYPFARDNMIYAPADSIIGIGDFFVEVAPVCSGLEGIGLIFVFTGLYLVSARAHLRFPRALLLLPLAIVLVWIGNTIRIALLIGVGATLSPEVALSGFHSKAGWLFFVAVALFVVALAQRSAFFSHSVAVDEHGVPTWNPTATYLAPLLALIGTTLVTGLWTTGLDRFYVVRVLAVALALYVNREHLPTFRWPPSLHAPAIGVAVFVVWIALVPRATADDIALYRSHLAELSEPERLGWLAVRVFGSTVTVPLAEELGFRAFLLRRLVAAEFLDVPKTRLTVLAVLVSSVAFGLLHNQAWLAGTLAGGAYALAQCIRGRTADAVVAHAITNALIAIDVLAFGEDWLWL